METYGLTETRKMPALALRGLVIFPEMMIQFDVGRKKSILALADAMERDQTIFLVAQKDLGDNEPGFKQLYSTGVVAKIKQVVRHSDEGVRLFAEGLYRARLVSLSKEHPFLEAEVEKVEDAPYRETHRTEALLRHTQNVFEEYVRNYAKVPPDIILGVVRQKHCGKLADYIAMNTLLDYTKKQEILDEERPVRRLQRLDSILEDEIKVLAIENEINEKAKEQIDQNQREYFLREQMKAIAYELGEEDSPQEEADELREKILKAPIPEEQQKKLLKECDRLSKMPVGSHEGSVILTYLETCLELPWGKETKEHIDLAKARKILDRDHYGLDKVKERILEILAVKKLAPDVKGQIICLVGPPGVGKTSIAHSIAEAINRKYVRVSLGGVRDESDIMGHRKTYIGSMPGRIISALKQAGTKNPLLLLDEIDKLGSSYRGDPASALLEVLDPDQNAAFYDHYIDMPFDLSDVLFITTANDASTIPAPLLDRMDMISLGSYTHEEKFQIASRHLIPKQRKKNGISAKNMQITSAALHDLIDGYTAEAGVRTLERQIASLCRKCAKKIVEEPSIRIRVTPAMLEELLGPKRFKKDTIHKSDEVGLVNGLAWTSIGGTMLPLEVAVMEGNGKIELTGSLGDVMKESARTAISCIRGRADELGIRRDFYTKYDIHIHAPEGAVPKDGPSAGTAMATAITSALTGIPIRHDVAMTGEITLLGRVLPIGGLKEKTMAAYRAGIKTVLIPADNEPDLYEVDKTVKEHVEFIPVERVEQVLEKALVRRPVSVSVKDSAMPAPVSESVESSATSGLQQ
ncbi:MAG: endopeptidase La [Hydrogeniiclostridium sp.]